MCPNNITDITYATLSSEELTTVKQFEEDFARKHGNTLYLLAFINHKK
ncbi:MAG TPA: hypothetical protein PKA28_03650 [Methylomusa anaerophila]|uniref:Uncharacterized protein n=1 Tax=Methylomusa anaerophila TaxID=1930071 RepID=A0A348ANH6_9FIRM|nr:hypothetical protein [Methylomusa anaerophila]BBB92624.1 hypothetical protein MAMMFC1_03319 [Methylomusa anaerophila]HML87522.1 hypothetical protein [Methylomusa anaerophila]